MDIQTKDGILLRGIPDGTPDEEIKARIQKIRAENTVTPTFNGKSGPDYAEELSYRMGRAKNPEMGQNLDFLRGASGTTRGAWNLVAPHLGLPELDSRPIPGTDKAAQFAGNLADPAALAIGGAVGKAMPYMPMFGKGVKEGSKALLNNAVSGGLAGGAIGGLSDEGTVGGGIAAGMGLMAGLPLALGSVRLAGQKAGEAFVKPFTESGQTQFARKWLADKLGSAKAAVIDALMNAKPIVPGSPVTAADAVAAANVGQPNKVGSLIVGAQNALERQPVLADLAKTQAATGEAARAGEIGTIAQTPQALNLAIAERRAVTTPMREVPLENANRFGEKVAALKQTAAEAEAAAQQGQQLQGTATGMEAQQAAKAMMPVSGVSVPRNPHVYEPPAGSGFRTRGELADNARKSATAANEAWVSKSVNEAEADLANWQLRHYAEQGLKPINGNELAAQVEGRLKDPTIGVSDLNKRVISKVAKKIREWTGSNGRLDAKALYEIRKTTINEEVDRLMPNDSASAKAKRAAGLLTDIKPIIDDTIEKAGGHGWKQYLAEFSKRSEDIDRMRIGQKLQEALQSPAGQEAPGRLLTTARNMEDELAAKLTPTQNAAVERVTRELERNAERAALGKNVDMGEVMHVSDSGKLEIPHILSRVATAANWLMGKMGTAADQKIAQDMGRMMLADPQGFAQKYLADIPPSRRQVIMAELRARLGPAAPNVAGAAVLNASQGNQ